LQLWFVILLCNFQPSISNKPLVSWHIFKVMIVLDFIFVIRVFLKYLIQGMKLFIRGPKHIKMVGWTLNYLINLHWVANHNQIIFGTFISDKRSLVLNVILNANFEIDNQRITTNIIILNANHSKIQQFHVQFCCLIIFIYFNG